MEEEEAEVGCNSSKYLTIGSLAIDVKSNLKYQVPYLKDRQSVA